MPDDLTGLPDAPPDDDPTSLEDHETQWGAGGTGPTMEDAPPIDPAIDPVADAEAEPAEARGPPPESPAAETPRDDTGRFKTRQPAVKDRATPKDVPRIQALTAKVRALEAEKAAWQAQTPPAPVAQTPPPVPAAVAPAHPPAQTAARAPAGLVGTAPTRPKPTEAQVGDTYPTYADFTEDLADWKFEQRLAQQQAAQQRDQQTQTEQTWNTRYTQQVQTLRTTEPDFDQVIAAADANPSIGFRGTDGQWHKNTQVLVDAIRSSAHGAAITSWLARHPVEYAQLVQDSLAVNAPTAIPMVRTVLESKLESRPVAVVPRPPAALAGPTGATSPPVRPPAPRPPTPVRTGPLKIGDDPPDDDSSLDAHEAYYHKSRR